MRWRFGYAATALLLLAIEAAIALWLDDALIRPHVGDALAVMLVYCGLRIGSPAGWRTDLALALATAFAIEFGQYAGLLHRLGWEGQPAARLLLGTSYDPRDLLSYVAGAAVIWCVEQRR
ncbi:DUF2809 domain-containing protein [Sphingomonas sp. KR1UV-12]|uniref:DUF2809 domain-containing protein n=1 Tax=Sphingomonas aurea TaxID=3063994 RepID=A0ABT9EII3_9SPHN|nr:DUF2809 domain-containing protein [Sphingomonas sp. KR1UV-12]MDP1026785.1 DUF2809 domain-containing protein [Sphingomonas sp. KR1UV-12]